MIVWFQVYILGETAFGFAAMKFEYGWRIHSHNNKNWIGEDTRIYNQFLKERNAKIVKICEYAVS